MADVARRAGVSTATVSYLLSGRDELMRRVGPEAQQRIRLAVRELGYIQNKTARHLRLQRTERLCLLVPRLGIPFADRLAEDVEAAANARGFSSIVVTAPDHLSFRRVVRDVEGGLADGLIADCEGISAAEMTELMGPIDRLGRACVMINPPAGGRSFSVVAHGRREALLEALDYVYAKGHRRLGYIANRSGRHNPRIDAVLAFAERHGLPKPLITDGAEARGRAAERAREIAALPERPSVVLLESDFSAVAALDEFQRLGLTVPDDIAVIGCGNAEEGYYCHPRLSTIGPVSLSMLEATEHLLDVITNRAEGDPRRWVVPWTLFPRESG
jgi:LacI family repressor for deo operon, udp, cdd, tsx, nupC, and nupG